MTTNEQLIYYLKYFDSKGWFPGNTGSLAYLFQVNEKNKQIFITPEGADKSDIGPNDIYKVNLFYGSQQMTAPLVEKKGRTISKHAVTLISLLNSNLNVKAAGLFITKWATLASRMALLAFDRSDTYPDVIRLAYWGLLNDLQENAIEIRIPVIEYGNEHELKSRVESVLQKHNNPIAIVIRNYGMFVVGDSLEDLKNKVDVLERLFELEVTNFKETK